LKYYQRDALYLLEEHYMFLLDPRLQVRRYVTVLKPFEDVVDRRKRLQLDKRMRARRAMVDEVATG
jgi:hypothetical protein